MGWIRWGFAIGVALLIVVGVVPLLIPIGDATGTRPVRELAGPGASFFEFAGIDIHYRHAGNGGPPRILLHGFGASLFSFREVFEPWSRAATVLAYDRPAFGLTERPWPIADTDRSPYTAGFNLDLLDAVIDRAGGAPAILIGNSAGAAVAIEFALAHPERVAALVLISPAVYTDGPPPLARLVSKLPQVERLGPRLLRWALPRFGQQGIDLAWHDPSRVTAEIRRGYALPLEAQHWDRALWAFSQARKPRPLAPRLRDLSGIPTLVVTGDDDRIVPTSDSVRLAETLSARLMVAPNCGHLAHEECPDAWASELDEFLSDL